MAFTQEQYDTVLEAINNTNLPTNLKADMVQIMDKGNPVRPRDFQQEFFDLPKGTVVEAIDCFGSTRIIVRDSSNQDNIPTLYYGGNRESMWGHVFTVSSLRGLNWEDFEEMHVLTRESGKPKAKNSLDDFEQFECGGREWVVLEDRADYDWWANNVRMSIHCDVVSLHAYDDLEQYTYVFESEMDDGNLIYTYPLYARKDGRDASVDIAFRRKFDLD